MAGFFAVPSSVVLPKNALLNNFIPILSFNCFTLAIGIFAISKKEKHNRSIESQQLITLEYSQNVNEKLPRPKVS